ncbi:MAG: sodium:solute symporter family protein [Geminicoccaceae bacterium]
METKIVWLFVFVALYWAFCLLWGVRGAVSSKTASDYFLAGRKIPLWVFMLAATAASFSGWTFMVNPGLIYQDGFQVTFVALSAITIPLTGLLFLKRQWILGRRFGFVTPGDMLAYYFRSDGIRILVVLVALVFSVPFLALMLRASGMLFNVVTDGFIPLDWGIWILAAVFFLYVAAGGFRAVANVGTLQCFLLATGIISIGLLSLYAVGGWEMFSSNIGHLVDTDDKLTPDGYSHYVAISGVIQLVPDASSAEGGAWTGTMLLTFMLALMGIQSAPAFSMWAFSSRSPAAFAPQQVWISAFGVGLMLLAFAAVQGIGSHFLGADLAFAKAHPDKISTEASAKIQASLFQANHRETIAPLQISEERFRIMTELGLSYLSEREKVPTVANLAGAGNETAKSLMRHQASLGDVPVLNDILDQDDAESLVIPGLINLLTDAAPWLIGFLSVCVLASLQSMGAAYMSTAGAMLTRDMVRPFILPNARDETQIMVGRVGMAVILLLAVLVATANNSALFSLGSLAVAYGFQMWPALIAVCFWPFLTRQGVILGLIAGLIVVTLTEKIGVDGFGVTAWGHWPLTIHAAGWGIAINFAIAISVSALMREHHIDIERKLAFHDVLHEHAALPLVRQALLPLAWAMTLGWFFFAIGPGAVIGNWIFGSPTKAATWFFGIPSIWAWQILFWVLGVLMMWFLAYVMQLSTEPETEIEVLADDIAELEPPLRG